MGILANVIVVTPGGFAGEIRGIELETMWWSSTKELRRRLVDCLGVEVDILRLYETSGLDNGLPANGTVTYVAQAYPERPEASLACRRYVVESELQPAPNRARYAHLDGPKEEIGWATVELLKRGIIVEAVEQIRTWNLSAVWRLATSHGDKWLKSVPDFFAHEGQVIEMLEQHPVPRLIAREPGRTLMHEMPGVEQFEALLDVRQRMIDVWVPMQIETVTLVDDLIHAGAPDWREGPFTEAIHDVVSRHQHELSDVDQQATAALLVDLPQRWQVINNSGVPDTLVHGDLHPGNVRIDEVTDEFTIFDWGDSGVGNALLDFPALASQGTDELAMAVKTALCDAWRKHSPGSHPEAAFAAIEPICALRQATIYRKFLDSIEPAEHIYHQNDPGIWLTEAAKLFAKSHHVSGESSPETTSLGT